LRVRTFFLGETINEISTLTVDREDVPLLQEVQRRDGERRRQPHPGHPRRPHRQGRGQQLQVVRAVLLDSRKVRKNGKK
jgi:hypothetical protein